MEVDLWLEDVESVEYDPSVPLIRIRTKGGKLSLFLGAGSVGEVQALQSLESAIERARSEG